MLLSLCRAHVFAQARRRCSVCDASPTANSPNPALRGKSKQETTSPTSPQPGSPPSSPKSGALKRRVSALSLRLGEQVTERGIGNGISILIFTGIVAGLPSAIGQTAEQARQGEIHLLLLFVIAAIVFAVTYFVVFVERGRLDALRTTRHRGGRSTSVSLYLSYRNCSHILVKNYVNLTNKFV